MRMNVWHVSKNLLRRVKKNVLDLSINSKIMLYYLILLIISVMLSSILYQQVLSNTISGKVSDIAFQMLQSISANFNSTIDIAGEYSKIINANEEIQDSLRNATDSFNFYYQLKASNAISRLMGGSTLITSVYIFDNFGNRYHAHKEAARVLSVDRLENAPWYREVKDKRGGFILRLNAGGVLSPAVPLYPGFRENYISLIREVNDLNSQKTMGVIIINISEHNFERILKSAVSNYNTEIAILDPQNNVAVRTGDKLDFNVGDFAVQSDGKERNLTVWKSNDSEYMATYMRIPENGWKIVSIIPIRELSKESSEFNMVAIVVITGNSLLLFIGSIIISRFITVPIKKLLKSMKGIEKGEFKLVDIKTGNDEIGKLRDGYNAMIVEIQNLISKIMEEQKMKRKTELDVLQAQIKPHFLYNTFDAISSLALAGKNKDVYAIMKALGTYYRTSLSKGREVITVGEEVDVVVNYLKIQKYRYEEMFEVSYDIDEEAKSYKILKLVLQPFVENALYHGIRPKNASGNISVSAKCREDCILLQITDDGVGMDEGDVKKLTSGKAERENPGFGVWGTIERLRIFYGVEDVVSIESQKGVGTTVSIRIPLQGEHQDAK
ncbi:MAG: sensor histidine kinase [Clostridia bacterium]|nr:sensor histidine kinase [Clostridia bacterium]